MKPIAEHDSPRLDHIAIAVRNLEEAITYFRDALGLTTTHTEEVPGQGARVGFIPLGDTNLELVQPTSSDGGLARFVEQRGEGLHHICLEVQDIRESLRRFQEKRVPLIDREPRPGAHGKQVAFLHPKGGKGVLIELSQPKAKPD